MPSLSSLANGYYVLPPGKLANAVTWLEMRARPLPVIASPLRLQAVTEADLAICRELYAAVGTPWLWSSAWGSGAVGDDHFALNDAGHRIGIVQFSGRPGPDVEISFFGLRPEATGAGLGKRMMQAALDLAWTTAARVWLHTCNFDHPAALRFYLDCGFLPYAAGFEIMDDPRLHGLLPRDTAPHVPMIVPEGETDGPDDRDA